MTLYFYLCVIIGALTLAIVGIVAGWLAVLAYDACSARRGNRRELKQEADRKTADRLAGSIAVLERSVAVPMETLIADAEQVAIRETQQRPRTHAEQHDELHNVLVYGSRSRRAVPFCDDCEYADIRVMGRAEPIARALTGPCARHSAGGRHD
jgi:hypothetical protein